MKSEMGVEGRLVENVLEQLEAEFSKRTSPTKTADKASAGKLMQASNEKEREIIKEELAEAMSVSSQTQRLYFVVRSMIMSILGAIIAFVIVWHLGTINVIGDFVLGICTYAGCLVVSRMFDERIVNVSRQIVLYLDEHARIRDFVLKNF
jgi:Flp pilus assembly protein TadB